MIYFLVTTSLFIDCPIRQKQYMVAISKLKDIIQSLNIQNSKIIIIENNGERDTFLNILGCEVYYTNNNSLPINNKGYKELQDVLDCIEKYNIQDTDFIVKMTGRYILNDNSEFMNTIKNMEDHMYDAVVLYGPYFKPVHHIMNDCVTGLIGMTCSYIKQIEKPAEGGCVEWNWAKVTNLMDRNKICVMKELGINICPASNTYFMV